MLETDERAEIEVVLSDLGPDLGQVSRTKQDTGRSSAHVYPNFQTGLRLGSRVDLPDIFEYYG